MKNNHALPRVFHPALNLLLAGFGLLIAALSVHLSGQTPNTGDILAQLFKFFDSPITALLILLGSFLSIYLAMFVSKQSVSCWLVLAGLLGFACPVAESFVLSVSDQNFLIEVMAMVGVHAAIVGISMGMVWYVFKDEGQAFRGNSLPKTQADQ
jgi:uncharacterized integral membrane protein